MGCRKASAKLAQVENGGSKEAAEEESCLPPDAARQQNILEEGNCSPFDGEWKKVYLDLR